LMPKKNWLKKSSLKSKTQTYYEMTITTTLNKKRNAKTNK